MLQEKLREKSDELNELVLKKELSDRQVLIQEEEIKHLEETNADTKRKVIQLQEELEKQRKAMKELQQVNLLCCVGFHPVPTELLGVGGGSAVDPPFQENDCVSLRTSHQLLTEFPLPSWPLFSLKEKCFLCLLHGQSPATSLHSSHLWSPSGQGFLTYQAGVQSQQLSVGCPRT